MALLTCSSSTHQFMETSTVLQTGFFARMVTWRPVSRYRARHQAVVRMRQTMRNRALAMVTSKDLGRAMAE